MLELLAQRVPLHGIAHVTGGGPDGQHPAHAAVRPRSGHRREVRPRPAVFDWLQRAGNVARDEMYRTFNCGLGMTITVPASDADRALQILRARGETVAVIGEVRAGDREVVIVE